MSRDKSAFEKYAEFILDYAFKAIFSEIEGKNHISKIPPMENKLFQDIRQRLTKDSPINVTITTHYNSDVARLLKAVDLAVEALIECQSWTERNTATKALVQIKELSDK